MQNACAITGHRPNRFSFGYDEEHHDCIRLKCLLAAQVKILADRYGITRYYTGLDLGADMWTAEAVLALRAGRPEIGITAVLPCEEKANRWSAEYRQRYFELQAKCDRVVFASKTYTEDCIFKRDRQLVDNAMYLLAVHDGGARSGPGFTVQYAREQGRRIFTIHPDSYEVTTPEDTEAYRRRRAFEVLDNSNTE